MAGHISNQVCSVNILSDTDSSSNTKSVSLFLQAFKCFSVEKSDKAPMRNKKQQVYKNQQHDGWQTLYRKASSSLKSWLRHTAPTGSSKGKGLRSGPVSQNLYFLSYSMGSIPLLLFTLSTTLVLPGIIRKPRTEESGSHWITEIQKLHFKNVNCLRVDKVKHKDFCLKDNPDNSFGNY